MARRQIRGQERGRDQTRARGRVRTESIRAGLGDLEGGFFPEYISGHGRSVEDLEDDERDGDLALDDDEDADATPQALEETEAEDDLVEARVAGWRLRDALGSRPPVVLVRLRWDGARVRASVTMPAPTRDAAESLQELAQFLEHVFQQDRASFSADEWQRLLGLTQCSLSQRFLLLERLAIEGSAKVEIVLDDGSTNKFTPHDRGLERYAAKFAALPDGTPFSLRLLFLDQRGRKDESDFGRLSPFVKLEAIRRALARERETGEACDDETFRFRFQEAAACLGLEIAAPTWKQITTLREWLKRNGLAHVFPKSSERQKIYDAARAEAAP